MYVSHELKYVSFTNSYVPAARFACPLRQLRPPSARGRRALPGGLACIYEFVRDTYEFVRECMWLRILRPSSARGRRVLPGGLACIYEFVRDTYEFVRDTYEFVRERMHMSSWEIHMSSWDIHMSSWEVYMSSGEIYMSSWENAYDFENFVHHPLAVVECCQAVLPAYISSWEIHISSWEIHMSSWEIFMSSWEIHMGSGEIYMSSWENAYYFENFVHHPLAVVECCQAVLPAYMSTWETHMSSWENSIIRSRSSNAARRSCLHIWVRETYIWARERYIWVRERTSSSARGRQLLPGGLVCVIVWVCGRHYICVRDIYSCNSSWQTHMWVRERHVHNFYHFYNFVHLRSSSTARRARMSMCDRERYLRVRFKQRLSFYNIVHLRSSSAARRSRLDGYVSSWENSWQSHTWVRERHADNFYNLVHPSLAVVEGCQAVLPAHISSWQIYVKDAYMSSWETYI